MQQLARVIAHYLPQFYPIPENDEWWGKGFTEWTNVTKAVPLYPGHYQPDLPSDLGFYDLRVPETRKAQADLARANGIEGFAYWHYWFGNGKRILNRVFDEVLATSEPNFPFCVGWANESWTGVWHGLKNKTLIEQTYPGEQDTVDHFKYLLKAFVDPRYIKVEGRPLILIHRPELLPEPRKTLGLWRELARVNGLPDLYFLGCTFHNEDLRPLGFDASYSPTFLHIEKAEAALAPLSMLYRLRRKLMKWQGGPMVMDYRLITRHHLNAPPLSEWQVPVVTPNWDNTPRCGRSGRVLHNPDPEYYRQLLKKAVREVSSRPPEHRIILLKSWNEWAEGNYLEPSRRFGHDFLRVTREEIEAGPTN